jgi:hypothetical protein
MRTRRIVIALASVALVGGLVAGSTGAATSDRPTVVAGPQMCC